jgi:hypothetical protein
VLVVVQVVAVPMTALAEVAVEVVVLINRVVGIEGVLEQPDVQGKRCNLSFTSSSLLCSTSCEALALKYDVQRHVYSSSSPCAVDF